jgi:endoglucanase
MHIFSARVLRINGARYSRVVVATIVASVIAVVLVAAAQAQTGRAQSSPGKTAATHRIAPHRKTVTKPHKSGAACRARTKKRSRRWTHAPKKCTPHTGRRPIGKKPIARPPAGRPTGPTLAPPKKVPTGTNPGSTALATAHASQATLNGWNMRVITDPPAVDGSAISYGWNGTAHFQVELPADADEFFLRVRGDDCAGPPAYTVTVDNVTVASDTASSATWTTKAYSKLLLGGAHTIDITYANAYYQAAPPCLRNLYLDDLAFSATSGQSVPAASPIPGGFVHQSGTQLLDGADQPLRLHGVNLGGFLSWEGWIWGQGFDYIGQTAMLTNLTSLVGPTAAAQFQSSVYSNYTTAADFKAISAYGMNVARVPFNYKLLEDDANPFVYKPSGWNVLDNLVTAAKQNNVYLVLVMQAAPCGQSMAFVSDYTPPNFLWWSSQCQARTVAMWKAIAARYASQNVVAGYDLLGEPVTSDQSLLTLYQQITAAIRQVDPNHVLIYEGNNAALSFSAFTARLDSNEMVSPHDYAWEEPAGNLSGNISTYDALAAKLGAPLYIGEFGQGTYGTLQQQIAVYDDDPLIAGWTDWTYKQSPGLPALQTIQESPDAQMLIAWMNNTSRPKPSPAEAQQGMSDFINEIQFAHTLPDARMQQTLR